MSQKNSAVGATGATYVQADTHNQAASRRPRKPTLPRPHAAERKRGVQQVNFTMQDSMRLLSTVTQAGDKQIGSTTMPPQANAAAPACSEEAVA